METLLAVLMLGLAASADAPFYANKANLRTYIAPDDAAHPVETPADWQKRRTHILANMQRVMGPMPGETQRVPADVQVLGEEDFPGYTRKKISIAVESWDRLPAYLLVPKDTAFPVPGVLCLHPTYADGKDIVVGISGRAHRQYAAELAERGYVTLAPDYPGFGDYVAARKRLYEKGYESCTMKAIWNHMRAVDVLQTLPEVDPARIGCIGHSLGGHNTFYLGVFDERVKAMVSSCGFNSFAKYKGGDLTGWSHDGYMPKIASEYGCDPAKMPFDFTEVLGALAPRAVFINAPLNDDNFEVSGVRDCVRAATPVYGLHGAAGNLAAVYPEAEHDFPDANREEAYAFLDLHLKR